MLPALLWLALAACSHRAAAPAPPAAYAPAQSCRGCHADVAETYSHVAMARSLYRPTPANVIEDYRGHNQFFHAPSNRYYRMVEREGRFYQQRYQLDSGREINLLEQEVTYIM